MTIKIVLCCGFVLIVFPSGSAEPMCYREALIRMKNMEYRRKTREIQNGSIVEYWDRAAR